VPDAGPEDRASGDMGRGQREPEVTGDQNHRRGRGIGSHTLRWADVDQSFAEGADDPPAADVGATGDGYRTGDLHPSGYRVGGLPVTAGDQRQRYDSHGLLGIVGAVRQRDQ